MKRVLIFIQVLAVTFLLFGCAKKEAAPKVMKDVFQFNAGIIYNDLKLSAQIMREADGTCTMKFTDPAPLSGMEMKYQNGEVKVNYMGLKWDVTQTVLPDTAVAEGIINTLESIKNSGDISASRKDGNIIISGESKSGKYQLFVDEKTKKPVYAKLPDLGLEFSIEDFEAAA